MKMITRIDLNRTNDVWWTDARGRKCISGGLTVAETIALVQGAETSAVVFTYNISHYPTKQDKTRQIKAFTRRIDAIVTGGNIANYTIVEWFTEHLGGAMPQAARMLYEFRQWRDARRRK